MFNLYNLFFDEVTNLENLANSRMAELNERQANMEEKIDSIQKEVKNISIDIYGEEIEDEEDYNFTIECPYCDNEFTLEVEDLKDEIECPKCNNVIELDWGHGCDEEGCCGCGHHCHHDEDDDM